MSLLSCLFQSGREVMAIPQAWAYRKGFPYRRVIDHVLDKLIESGVYSRILKRASLLTNEATEYECEKLESGEIFQIGLMDVEPYFRALAVGLACSLVSIVAERILRRRNALDE